MATAIVNQVRIAGIASAVPERTLTLEDDARIFGHTEIERISQNIGVRSRHVVDGTTCTSDLCYAAATRLLDQLQWDRGSIEALIVVTQTPDYFMPATACVLQRRLELPTSCAAFDVNQGCAGYIYGLWLAAQLVRGGCRRLLLLVGDTISRVISPRDRTVTSLFGDAGTATALEYAEDARPMYFELGTDGGGRDCLIVPAGAFRHPHSPRRANRASVPAATFAVTKNLPWMAARFLRLPCTRCPAWCSRSWLRPARTCPILTPLSFTRPIASCSII